MDKEDLISILKAQQWEKCKGELMALIALEERHTTTYNRNMEEKTDLSNLEEQVKFFIEGIEEDALNL